MPIVLGELEKIYSFVKGVPWEYSMPVHQTPNLEVSIWVVSSVKNMIKGRTVGKNEVSEKRKNEGCLGNNNNNNNEI